MRTKFTTVAILSSLTALAPAALAQTTDPVSVSAAAAPSAIDSDPNIDRGFLLPTAMTQPAGSFTYNNYELLLHGLTYGLTDRVQLSATVLSPITRDMPFFGTAAVKARAYSGERLHLALQGSASYGHSFDSGSDGNVGMLGAGALASVCLRSDCSSLLSGSATYQLGFVFDDQSDGTAHMLVYGASIVHRVGRHVKLLGELTSAAVRTQSDSFDNAPGLLASYGVRFHGNSIAGDVGFMKPLITDDGGDDFLLGLPFINLSYRW
jgi:hypothetical protein